MPKLDKFAFITLAAHKEMNLCDISLLVHKALHSTQKTNLHFLLTPPLKSNTALDQMDSWALVPCSTTMSDLLEHSRH